MISTAETPCATGATPSVKCTILILQTEQRLAFINLVMSGAISCRTRPKLAPKPQVYSCQTGWSTDAKMGHARVLCPDVPDCCFYKKHSLKASIGAHLDASSRSPTAKGLEPMRRGAGKDTAGRGATGIRPDTPLGFVDVSGTVPRWSYTCGCLQIRPGTSAPETKLDCCHLRFRPGAGFHPQAVWLDQRWAAPHQVWKHAAYP